MGIKELLFPPKCMLCGNLLGGEEEICSDCRAAILLNTAPPRMGGNGSYDLAAAGLWYEGSVRRAIHGLKYHEKQSYARPLARVMEYTLRHKLEVQPDLVTYVPTNPSTLKKRGYDQAELLAEELAKRLSLPLVHALEKTRETHVMHDLTPEQRRENVKGAFRLRCDREIVQGKRILIADDVLTTGATLSACAAVLKQAGATEVYGLCAAAGRRHTSRPLGYLEQRP